MTEYLAKQNEDEFSITYIEDKENTNVEKNDYSKYLEYTEALAITVIGGGCVVMAAPFVWGLIPAGMAATAVTAAVTAVAKEVEDGHICLQCTGSYCGLTNECGEHS